MFCFRASITTLTSLATMPATFISNARPSRASLRGASASLRSSPFLACSSESNASSTSRNVADEGLA